LRGWDVRTRDEAAAVYMPVPVTPTWRAQRRGLRVNSAELRIEG